MVSFAQNEGSNKPVADCHSGIHACKAVFYMRPYAIVNSSPSACSEHPDVNVMAAASESWFVHLSGYSDSAHRVYGKDPRGCTIWAMDPNTSAMQSWWLNYLRSKANNYDLMFIDMSPMSLGNATYFYSGGGCSPWPHVCLSTQELPNDAAVVAARVNFVSALNYRNGSPMFAYYQQAYPTSTEMDDLTALAATTRLEGVTCEGCIATWATPVHPANYKPYLDEMAAVIAGGDTFYVISDGSSPTGSATQTLQRLVTTGFIWLAYKEGQTIVQPNLESATNNLAIWPEDLIYPSQPVQTMISGSADLQVSSGVWRREFKTCYQASRFFGRCAAILNSTSSTITVRSSWLTQSYQHVVSLSGGDVLSGGTATVAVTPFTPNVTTVAPGAALLLSQ